MKLIDKDALVAEIEKIRDKAYPISDWNHGYIASCEKILSFIDTLEVKEIEIPKAPKHSYFETIYHCGAEPMWKVGDILAVYECYSDREGEYVYGEVISAKNGENDWIYTIKSDFGGYEDICEKGLIYQGVYKKNK